MQKALSEKNHELYFALLEGLVDDWENYRRQGSIGNILDKPRALSQYGAGKKKEADLMVALDPQNYMQSLSTCLGKAKDEVWAKLAEKRYQQWLPHVHSVLLKNEVFKRYERLVSPSLREKERRAQLPGEGEWGKGGYDIGVEV